MVDGATEAAPDFLSIANLMYILLSKITLMLTYTVVEFGEGSYRSNPQYLYNGAKIDREQLPCTAM